MRWFGRVAATVLVLVTVLGAFRARADAPPAPKPAEGGASSAPKPSPLAPITSLEVAEVVYDPALLVAAGRDALAANNAELARGIFKLAVEREEMALYFGKQKEFREARILELLGDFAGAEAQWKALQAKDPLHTAIGLRIASIHPERERLFQAVITEVKALAERAKAGQDTQIYVTSKGEPRNLEVITAEGLSARLAAAAKSGEDAEFKYCYIENVDLTGVDPATLPAHIEFNRCVLGNVTIPNLTLDTLVTKGFVLGDFHVGKTWSGAVNVSNAVAGSRFKNVTTRETVFLGKANFQDVSITGRKAAFPLTVFESVADFRGARIGGQADWRFSSFGGGANFKRARMEKAVFFGNSRFLAPTRFTEFYSAQRVYFDSARFEAPVHFDGCEFAHSTTFENAQFASTADFNSSSVAGRLNLSRTTFNGAVTMKEVTLGGLDLLGAQLLADLALIDARVSGKVRFSLDDVSRARALGDPTGLLPLYRDYQGDEDAEEPLVTGTSYGVRHVDDLIARIDHNLSFASTVFGGFVIFDRVVFGQPGKSSRAEFYNTQFGGETHFERTEWHSSADFSTIYAEELALNEAVFHHTLVLDDANVPGRVTLTDAKFDDEATLSFYGAQITNFQIDRSQVESPNAHRLWYERCALGTTPLQGDVRYERQRLTAAVDDDAFRLACYARAIDEFVSLKQSFGDRAMTSDEDWAYWWIKHHESFANLAAGGVEAWLSFPVRWVVFELAFGWGVRLGNLAVTAALICFAFAWIYKRYCPDTVMSYNGDDVPIRDIPWVGMLYISAQSLGGFNTGWDFGESSPRFRYLNTTHTFLGVIILTFFVGAYTRMILA